MNIRNERNIPHNNRKDKSMPFQTFIRVLILLLLTVGSMHAQNYQPATENLKNREWFQNAKFGLFIHWGVYSVLGDGEWIMNNRQIPIGAYEKLPAFFNPIEFDAKAWVQMAKDAGMKYITITSKHHDGFSLWDSKQTEFDVMSTPFKRDILKELADACRKIGGVKLCFYHSIMDWHHPDYNQRRED